MDVGTTLLQAIAAVHYTWEVAMGYFRSLVFCHGLMTTMELSAIMAHRNHGLATTLASWLQRASAWAWPKGLAVEHTYQQS